MTNYQSVSRGLTSSLNSQQTLRSKNGPPMIVTFLAVACTFFAGLGDWKVLNDAFKGLPKAVALGTIACAFLFFLVDADFSNLKKAASYFPVYFILIAVYTFISMYIWVTDFSNSYVISRGGQKIFFQTITIIYAVCMCYLFETEATNILFFTMCSVNAAIMVLEMPKYGVAESILSVVTCLITFGDAKGFVRALEIHDITFLFGQFMIYYVMFAPRGTKQERRLRRIAISLCLFFMLVGLKRSTLPAVALMCIYVKIVRMTKVQNPLIMLTGVGLFLFIYLYLYLTRTGFLVSFLESLGIDMMGRNVLWSLPNAYYELSPLWKGLGFEKVTELVNMWCRQGLINHPYPLHNDILRIFIELGALGLTLWAGIHYLFYPFFWMSRFDTETSLLYMALLSYMTVTYLTDNTAFYFWCCIGLRMIPMSYSYRIFIQERNRRWKPLSSENAANEIWEIEMERKARQ